ncbi:MAG: Glucose-1-phosphate thymidylyltransferase [Bacteroidetes bacterium ADurb.Bin217]|nr:MAG: Glucose-1-phosphate thymidylyltransferase [Bacteroidetes bacterium ADurb.Bin217]
MKIIIPMAGMGTRMRPHTLTVPKPLIPVYGKPIVQRLVEDITRVCNEVVDEIAFIVHPAFGKAVEEMLVTMAQKLGAKGTICYQAQAQGTAHAVLCAKEALKGNVIVAFADTLFIADFKLDTQQDAIIWVQQVQDPSAFGVVKLNSDGLITDFVEKPKEYVSDLAIIGIYYFKDGENLCKELQYLIDNDIHVKGEFQLTTALENMKNKGVKFYPGKVDEWLDCGNKNATVNTNTRLLQNYGSQISKNITIENSTIIEPCCIADGVTIRNSVVGPYVSVGEGTSISGSVIDTSIVQSQANIAHARITNSMIGTKAIVQTKPLDLSVSDYSEIVQ